MKIPPDPLNRCCSASHANANQVYKAFRYIRMVHFFLPSYMGIQRFIIASDSIDPYNMPKEKIKRRIKRFSCSLKYYDEDCHYMSLTLTKDIMLKNKYMRAYEKRVGEVYERQKGIRIG